MERSRKSRSSSASHEPGPIGVGAKGTIVSLMAKELQIEGSRKLAAAQIQHLPVRNESVSAYCGLKNTCKSSPAKNITKANSFKEKRTTSSCSNSNSPSVKQCTARSSSLRESSVRVLHFPSPKSMTVHHQRRKRIVTYEEAAGSGMFSFLDSDEDDSGVPFTSTTMTTTESLDDLVPILTPSRESVLKVNSSGSRLSQQCRLAYPSVEVADVRCYGAGRDMFRPAPKATKLSFWKLGEVKQSSKR